MGCLGRCMRMSGKNYIQFYNNMHITPWSIYDKPFHKPSRPTAANIQSSPIIKNYINTPKQQITSPKSKPQTFYSFSIMKPLEKQMNLLIALKCIHSTLEEPSTNCISLPRIANPLAVRHKSNSLQRKGKNKIKRIKVRQLNEHKHKTVDHEIKYAEDTQILDQCPFNDDKLIQNFIKFKLQTNPTPI